MGLDGSYAPCWVFSLLFSCCRAEGGHVGPPLHGHGWLIGVVSLWRNWSVFRVGNRSLAPTPAGRWFGRDTWHVGCLCLARNVSSSLFVKVRTQC